MPEPIRLTGMPQATPNGVTEDIRFVLESRNDEPIVCIADYDAASQIVSGLGQALFVLRMALAAKGSAVELSGENLSRIHVDRDILSGSLVLTLTTVSGVQLVFHVPAQIALELADELKTEARKVTPQGTA